MTSMKKRDPQEDPNSIGSILMSYGMTPMELSRAINYQRDNYEVLLGEACVRLGFTTRETLETAIRKQCARRSNSASILVRLAIERTKTMSASVGALAAVSIQLAEKIK